MHPKECHDQFQRKQKCFFKDEKRNCCELVITEGKLKSRTTWKTLQYYETFYERLRGYFVLAAERICYKDHNTLFDYHTLPEPQKMKQITQDIIAKYNKKKEVSL